MRKLLAKTAGSLKTSASRAAARMLRAFARAEDGHAPHAHHHDKDHPQHDRRHRRLLFGPRRRRAVDRVWGLHDMILNTFDSVRKRLKAPSPAASTSAPPHREPG